MSTAPLEEFENNELSGPYSADRIPELIAKVVAFVEASQLTERGKSVRSGQLTQKLLKCQAASWPGLAMVDVSFSHIEIYVDRQDEVINVVPRIVDTEGDSYDLDEASGKIEWMIPKAEILRRCEKYRNNRQF